MVDLRPARIDDVDALLQLRDDLARWQASLGVKGWQPGELRRQTIAAQVRSGEWHVLREDAITAALRLLFDDHVMWGERAPDSVYVHGLMVARSHAGRGLGAAMLDWAAERARAAGRERIRLDCIEDNPGLVGYYERLGYVRVGRRQFAPPVHSVALFEKRISTGCRRPARAEPPPAATCG